MAVLGIDGIVRLRREAPLPIVVSSSVLRADIDAIVLSNQDFWSGDEVYLFSQEGLPLSGQCSNGSAMYAGGFLETGPNRSHIADNDDFFYKRGVGEDSDNFYCGVGAKSAEYFVYKDSLNRLSFYTDYCSAVNGGSINKVNLAQYDFNVLLIAAAGTQDYNNALTECVSGVRDYRFSDVRDEVTLESICDFAPSYQSPAAGTAEYDDADLTPRSAVNGFPWVLQCELAEWSLELDGAAVDTTQVGEKFGENIKSIITGGGKFDFQIGEAGHSSASGDMPVDPSYLLQLLQLTERGAKAEAEFWLMQRKVSDTCSVLARGGLYYATNILITNIAVNVRATDVIVGSANFATSGEIALKVGV